MESSAQDKDGESQPGAAQGGEAEVAVTPAPAEKISGGRAARGARWTLFAFGAVQVIRFVSSIVLTWLVMPEAYGVIAVVMSVMMGINLFSDLGIGANIVQSASGADPRYRDTAWTIQILRGLILTLVAYAIAPVVGAYYSDYPGLSHFIQAISISSLILGLGSMSLHVLRRSISVARLSALEVFAQVMASATILIWAYYDPTPWAMVAGAIVRASTTTIARAQHGSTAARGRSADGPRRRGVPAARASPPASAGGAARAAARCRPGPSPAARFALPGVGERPAEHGAARGHVAEVSALRQMGLG